MRLFEDRGYDQTTVAEIASAAGVSTKTFFNYFASKDEVLFPHLSRRIDAAVALIEQRGPDDQMVDVLVAAMQHMLADALDRGSRWWPRGGAATHDHVRARRPSGHPAPLLPGRNPTRPGAAPRLPGHLDAAAAAAVIGSVMGAAIAAALVCLQEGDNTQHLRLAVERAIGIAMHGVRNVPTSA